MKTLSMLFALAILSTSTLCSAQATTAATLRDECRDVAYINNAKITINQAFNIGHCLGFMEAELTVEQMATQVDGKQDIQIVLANGVTYGQSARVFVAFIDKHPELENKEASIEVLDALSSANLVAKDIVAVPVTN